MSYSAKISMICDVQSGYTARGRLERVSGGGSPAVQLRDLNGDEPFDPSAAPLYQLDQSVERYMARAGDVLFRNRGDRNTAIAIAPTSTGAAVAVLPLVVLRPNRNVVDPLYLAWAINQPPAQRYLDKCALGTSMRMIPKAVLDDLEIELPDLSIQKLIIELDALARHENRLARELADKKLELTELALLERAKSFTHNAGDHPPSLIHDLDRRDKGASF